MPDKDGYPTEQELKTIREWRWLKNRESLPEFLEFLQEIWWHGDTGVSWSGKKILKLHLHTWGWSGNGEIISALQENVDGFWMFFWEQSNSGGHYRFRIPLKVE